jgi:hypothetical protein
MKRLLSILCLALLLTSCAPYAPHMWIADEFLAIQKHCLPGEEIGGKQTQSSEHRRWNCNIPTEFAVWEKKFITDLGKRGWQPITTGNPWKSMCHAQRRGVVISYVDKEEASAKKWSFVILIRFPAKECGSN